METTTIEKGAKYYLYKMDVYIEWQMSVMLQIKGTVGFCELMI